MRRNRVLHRRNVLLVLPVLAVVIAACAPAGDSGHPRSDRSTASPSTTRSASPSAHRSATPKSRSTAKHGPKGRQLWSVELGNKTSEYAIARSAGSYVLSGNDQVWSLSATGHKRWHFDPSKTKAGKSGDSDPDLQVKVTGGVAVVSYRHPTDDRWPHRKVIKAFDIPTGMVLWRDDKSSFVTTFSKTVYTTRCNGQQNGRRGNCMLAARRLHSGKPRWTVPTQASAQVRYGPGHPDDLTTPKDPRALQLQVFPHGVGDETTRMLDPASAQHFTASIKGGNEIVNATDTLVNGGHRDRNASHGCSQQVTGLDLRTGTHRWKHKWRAAKDGATCNNVLGDVRAGDLISSRPASKRPKLLNLKTGKSHWTSPRKGKIIWAGHKRVLTAGAKHGPYRLIDHRRDRQIWRRSSSDIESSGMSGSGVEVRAAALFGFDGHAHKPCSGSDCRTRVVDLKTGKPRYSAPGTFAGGGDGWVATAQEKKGHSRRAVIRAFTQP